MEQQNYSLDFIELIGLVKELNENILLVQNQLAGLKLDVNVEAPNIKVEPTPITVNEREIPKDLKAEITNLPDIDKFVKAIKEALLQPSVVSNIKDAKADTAKLEGLLEKLVKQKAKVEVKVEPNITLPYGTNPKHYIPVRLVDGDAFYNAIANLTSTHTVTEMSKEHSGSIVWKSVADKTVMDYTETVIDGVTYRKTFSYDSNGNLTAWTGWVRR